MCIRDRLRDAEIQDLHEGAAVALGDEQVVGLQIAVHDARAVSYTHLTLPTSDLG